MTPKFHTTTIIRPTQSQTHINYEWAGKRLADKRRWKDVVAAEGWDAIHREVKSGDMPRPTVMPIRRVM